MPRELDYLVSNAENLLEQAFAVAPESDVTVLQLATGGYYLIAGAGHDLAAMQTEHGARAGWQVTNSTAGVRVSGRTAHDSCLLKRERPGGAVAVALRDAPAYLLV